MKSPMPVLAAFGLLLWPCLPLCAESRAVAEGFQPLVINQTAQPAFPLAPVVLSYVGGSANILITVDESGRLTDTLAIYYTHPSFAKAAEDALRKWTYEPARLDGRPVTVTKEIDFNFERHGVALMSLPISEFADVFFLRNFPRATEYRAYKIHETDRGLNATIVVRPPYSTELAAKGVSGSVTLDYYVDEQGRVRMPVAVYDARQELVDLAVGALKQWQFDPPTRNGRPVLVRVRQEIRFHAPMGS